MSEFERLFHRVYPALVRFLSRRIGDADRAEDLAQEAFVRLTAHQPADPEGWLFVVAANLARDAHRRDQTRERHLVMLAREPLDREPDPDPVSAPARRHLQAALAQLSERDRTLLLLHQEGVSYRQLAEAVGVQPSSVAPLLARARQRLLRALRPFLEATDGEEDDDVLASA